MLTIYIIGAIAVGAAYLSGGCWDPKKPWREIFAALALGLTWVIWLPVMIFMGLLLWVLLTFFEE